MGQPNKEQDPGDPDADTPPRSPPHEGFSNIISSILRITPAADSVKADGTPRTPEEMKKKRQRRKQEEKFQSNYDPTPRAEPTDTNPVGNITKLLPANTFLMFQTLAPLATNDGNCGRTEIIMTSAVLIILAFACMVACFTDTVQHNGKVYSGLVTTGGLWNPSFKGDPCFSDLRHYENRMARYYERRRKYKQDKLDNKPCTKKPVEPKPPRTRYVLGSTFSSGNSQYKLHFTDVLQAVLSVTAFGTLTLLTSPVSTCFYDDIPSTVVKTLPLLVAFVISAIFAFSPPARNGIAHPLPPTDPSKTVNHDPEGTEPVEHESRQPSQTAKHKPADLEGVEQGSPPPPDLPGNSGHANPEPDHDDHHVHFAKLVKFWSNLFHISGHDKGKSVAANEHHHGRDLYNWMFSKHGDDMKHGGEARGLNVEGDVEKAKLLPDAATALAELGEDDLSPLMLQEALKSVPREALEAWLLQAAAHPALAVAAEQSAIRELQASTSSPLTGLSRQSSMALTRGNSILQSSGPSLNLPSSPEVFFHQTTQAPQRHASGISPNVPGPGSEAAEAARSLDTPATSVAQDLAALVTTRSQPTVSASNSLFIEPIPLGVAQGVFQAVSQPPPSVAIDVLPQLQQGSQRPTLLPHQAPALSPGVQPTASSTVQPTLSFGGFQQAPAVAAYRHLAAQLLPQPTSTEIGVSHWMSTSPSNWRDSGSPVIKDETAATSAQREVARSHHHSTQEHQATVEIVVDAAARDPTTSQELPATSEIVASASTAAGQAALPRVTAVLRSHRPETTETIDSVASEEISSESETELTQLSNRGNARDGNASAFSLEWPSSRKY